MSEQRGGSYSYNSDKHHLRITMDSGQSMNFYGKDAERMASHLGISLWNSIGRGTFRIAESLFNKLGRGSFR